MLNRNEPLFDVVYIYIFCILSFFLSSLDRSGIFPKVRSEKSALRKSYLCEVFIFAQFRFRVSTFCAIPPHFWRYNFSPLFLTLCAWHFYLKKIQKVRGYNWTGFSAGVCVCVVCVRTKTEITQCYIIPKPLAFWMAFSRRSFKFSRSLYAGNNRILKQVWAE